MIIPNKDEIELLIGLIKKLSNLSDDIAVYDSSSERHFAQISEFVKDYSSVKLHRIPPTGYPDPARTYALNLCKHEWVLYLDADEMVNPKLLKGIPNLIDNSEFNGFLIKRICVKADNSRIFFSELGGCFGDYQLRLFRKDMVIFKGIIHELPILKGDSRKLPSHYVIYHRINTVKDISKLAGYMLLELFENRYTFSLVRSKISPKLGSLWDLYSHGLKKDSHQELNPIHYLILTMLQEVFKGNIFFLFNFYLRMKSKILSQISNRLRLYSFEISKEVQKSGIPNLLNLTTDNGLKAYWEEYNTSQLEPVEFFISKLIMAYNEKYAIVHETLSIRDILSEVYDIIGLVKY